MSERFPGGVISATAVVPTPSSASGIWTLEQQEQAQAAGTWPFGGPFTYIEDVFSTWLYTGNGSTQTINNGIDLTTYGGLVWQKDRTNAQVHSLCDTVTGAQKYLNSASTAAQSSGSTYLQSFTSTGFNTGSTFSASGDNYASWTFRKQSKFFDVVTYTGDGTDNRNISHSLGSAPGCVVIKSTSMANEWFVYHRSLTSSAYYLKLSRTAAESNSFTPWSSAPTATTFNVNDNGGVNTINSSGQTYVAYLFAHNAGGFGLTGTDNVISCGSFTTDGSGNATVSLGYEPQYVLVKRTSASSDWFIFDTMRGLTVNNDNWLTANTADAESSGLNLINPTSTGFTINFSVLGYTSASFIYIAIRRGPMKTPTSGTSVFSPITTSSATGTVMTTNFPVDMQISGYRPGTDSSNWSINDRLRGVSTTSTDKQVAVITSSNAVETTGSNNQTQNWNNTGFTRPSWLGGVSSIYHNFRRAPGFFDEVCFYSPGSSAVNSQRHNLGVAPELIILKNRNDTYQWFVGANFTPSEHAFGYLNLTNSMPSGAYSTGGVFSAQPDATNFYYGNLGGFNYVAYLFASCPGVSKVGSYTGNGSTQTINCGFTGGARFVLIKRTDSTGSWFVWDTARGMVAGTDPRLALNSTAAESNADWVYTDASGFQIVTTDATVNASGGSYIYLCIA